MEVAVIGNGEIQDRPVKMVVLERGVEWLLEVLCVVRRHAISYFQRQVEILYRKI